MSRRMVFLVAFIGLITSELAAAQADSAPMPRDKPRVIVCAEGFFQVEVPSDILGNFGSTPACPSVIYFRPVPMPRAIVEVIGNIEFGYPETDWFGPSTPATIFRPARYRAAPLDGTGGWWLDEARMPQVKYAIPQMVGENRCLFATSISPGEPNKPEECTVLAGTCKPSAGLSQPCVSKVTSGCCGGHDKLSGTWYREIEGAVFAATFSCDELKMCMTQCEDGFAMCFTVTADYAVTKDGIVHGVVTGVDVQASRETGRTDTSGLPTAAMTAELQKLVDCPFSFRTRMTSAGVMMSNLRIAMENTEKPDLAMACGMFKHAADGKVPSPKQLQTSAGPAAPRSTPEFGTYRALPRALSNVTPTAYPPATDYLPSRPTNVPPGDFGMMAEVFGQMLGPKLQPLPVLAPPAARSEPPAQVPTMPTPPLPRIEKPH